MSDQDQHPVPPNEDLPQGLLFDEVDFFVGGSGSGAERYAKHTGTSTERRDQLVQAMLERLVAGASQREIARVYGVSRNTVAAIVQRAEANGQLEPYKQRVSKRLGKLIEAGVERFAEAIEQDEVSPSQLPVSLGILMDKKVVLDGEPTSVVEHRKGPAREDLEQYLQSLASAKAVDVESERVAGDEQGREGSENALPAADEEADSEGTTDSESGSMEA